MRKKYSRSQSKKYFYQGHSTSSTSRLRIAGKFVTRVQAYAILGLNQEESLENEKIQQMLNRHNKYQRVKEKQNVLANQKVRNFKELNGMLTGIETKEINPCSHLHVDVKKSRSQSEDRRIVQSLQCAKAG